MSLALKIVLLIASVILILSILLQSSNSAGLSGSIGGEHNIDTQYIAAVE